MAVSNYNPKDIKFIFGGVPITGFDEDDFLTIEPISDGVTSKSGADSEIARSMGTDMRHTVTLRLLQTAAANAILSAFYDADRVTPGGAMLPLLVQDLGGNTTFAVSQAWITKKPASGFGREVGNREWVIETGEPTVYTVGGASR